MCYYSNKKEYPAECMRCGQLAIIVANSETHIFDVPCPTCYKKFEDRQGTFSPRHKNFILTIDWRNHI